MAQTYDRRINLYINGTQVKNDISSIRKEMYKLTNEQARMTIGSDEYRAHAAKIKTLKGIMQQHNADLNNVQKSWFNLGKMADGFNRYFAMATAFIASFAGVALTVKSTVQAFAEYDDKLADVMKTTGLTKKEVQDLDKAFADIDTRSSQQELLDLARVAGKLGYSTKEDVLGFVLAADKIKVSLSEDLGGDVEESINSLGKLVDIFKLEDEFGIEQALLKVGSAINSLGAAGTANEAYLVEFAKRVAGIAPSADISIDKVLGLAATLDELGQTSEMSTTAVAQVISKMFKETATYAGIAQMSVEDFTNLLNTDANEAFIRLLQGAKGSGEGFGEMAVNLDKMGLDGVRSTQVLGVLADNIDKLREKQAFSNAEFEKGTSILNEFNIKNNTTQAQLDKAKDSFARLQVQLGEKLAPIYGDMIHKGSAMLRIFAATVEFLIKYGSTLVTLTALIIAYTVAVKAAALWEARLNKEKGIGLVLAKLNAAAYHAQFAAIALYNAAVALLTGNLKKAAIQMRAFGAALNATPLGVALTVIAALVIAIKTYDQVNARAVENEKQKRQAVANLTNANKLLEGTYSGINRQINDLNTLSIQEKKDLQDKIDLTLRQAEAELLAQQARQTEIQQNNTRATLWQTVMNAMKAGGNGALALAYNAADAAANGAEAAATMNDGLGALLANIENLRTQKVDLGNILNAEAIGDAIGTETLVQMEEKMNRYQLALKNAAVGSEDFLRIQQKINTLQKEMGSKQVELADPKETEKRNKEQLDALELALTAHQNLIKQSLFKSEITQDEYEARMLASELGYLELKKQMLSDQGESTVEVESQIWDKRIALAAQKKESIEKLQKQMDDDVKEFMDAESDKQDAEVAAAIKTGEAVLAEKQRLKDKEQQIMEQRAQAYLNLAQGIGESFEEMLLSQEMSFGQFLKNTLMMALDALEKIMIMSVTQATMDGIAKSGFDPTALIKAFAKIVAIKAAFASVKALVMGGGKKVEKKATGGYTKGESMYIAGEAGKEWIAPNRMLSHPVTGRMIAALEEMRSGRLNPDALPAFASGGFTNSSAFNSPPGTGGVPAGGGGLDPATANRLIKALDDFAKKKLVVTTELIKKDLDTLDEIDKKR